MEASTFSINVRDENYLVDAIDLGSEFEFKISTACNYIMTVHLNEEGIWSANKDVEVLDETLVEDIGDAIEKHNA